MFTTLPLVYLMTSIHASVIPQESAGVQITTLGSDRPIYYDTIGKVQLIHDEWRLLMYYNLSTYWSGVQRFENYLQDIAALCNKLEPRFCQTTIRQLSHEMDILHYYNEVLLAPHKHLSYRSKRGLIDGVGYVANSLFGILDQRFADEYHKDIQNVQKNEDYILRLLKNQTSIVEIENDILKKNEDNINRQFTLINNFMNETDIRLAKIESGIEIAMATSFLTSTALAAHLLLKNLKSIQETFFNTFLDVYKGRMDVHLISPVNLIQQLTIISGKLPKTLTLPIDNIQEDTKDIYNLIYVKARVTDTYFLYELHIPLASDEDFTVYQIIPLPMKNPQKQDKTTVISVSFKYIAANLEKNTYIRLNENELNRCIQRRPENFVCIRNLPIFSLQNAKAPCEATLLGQHSTLPCIAEPTQCETAWIELHNTNTWLVTCCNSCTIRTVCHDNVRSHVINTSSIVSLKQGCLLQTKELKIHSHNNYDSNAKLDYDIQVPTLDKTINSIVDTHTTPLLQVKPNKDIAVVEERLRYLKSIEQLPTTITTHDIHQYVISYVLLTVIGVAIIAWLAKRRGYCTKKTNDVNHQTRHSITDVEMQSKKPPAKKARDGADRMTSGNPPPTRRTLDSDTDIEFKF
ncbi:hypothetical protein HF086_005203 [Spodoptera exigua]|uniref:Envelope fusion protein n=1 Tax=Spodoptera exigua TaxID=7107 RepID=A0A922MZ29_SPOEX|nr:hypothetical protein HF086_005203 [Spodoptera exigua]